MATPDIACRIADCVDEKHLSDFVKELVRIPSVTGQEAEASERVAKEMERIGLTVENIGLNIIGRWESAPEAKTLVLCGHVDTVPVGDRKEWTCDPYGGEIRDGKLYGRGACDMKAGVGAMIAAIDALKKANTKLLGNMTLIANICEETSEKLSKRKGIIELLDRNVVKGDAVIITEPTDLVIALGHKATCEIVVEIRGKSAHSGLPHEGINAIEKAAKLIVALRQLRLPQHPVLGAATLSVTLINGGTVSGVVPDYCKMEINRRLTKGESLDTVKREMETLIESIHAEDKDFKAEASYPFAYEPILVTPNEPAVKSLARAYSLVVGKPPETGTLSYGTDGAFIHQKTKIPVVIFGPGNIRQAHGPDEYVEVEQIFTAAKVYAVAAVQFLGLHES
jgi:acetylornithine deacetylase/succinyl-diaminopimelate desuccinylase family protein